jgi:hypothetical protein
LCSCAHICGATYEEHTNLIPYRLGIPWPNFDKSEELIDTAFQTVGKMDGEPELAEVLREKIRSTSGSVGDAKRVLIFVR